MRRYLERGNGVKYDHISLYVRIKFSKIMAGEKTLGTKPDNLNLIPRTYRVLWFTNAHIDFLPFDCSKFVIITGRWWHTSLIPALER